MSSKILPWTFISAFYDPQICRVILHIDIEKCNYTNVIVEPHPESSEASRAGSRYLENRLVELHAEKPETESATFERDQIIEQIMSLCRNKYGRGAPPFGSVIYALTSNGIFQVRAMPDHRLVQALRNPTETFGDDLPLPPLVSRTKLLPVSGTGQFLLSQTRLVEYNGKLYIAKGPLYPHRALLDLSEVKNLLALPTRHPNVIGPPAALITLGETDDRVCGFLTTYHCNGNVEFYARKLREQGKLSPKLLFKWALQLVDAVAFLARHNTFHGDLKPDNIVVTDKEDIVLIDFTRLFTTFVTASPEVRKLCAGSGGTKLGIPAHWPMESVLPSEVYSIGRTLYLLCEGFKMAEVYHEMGWTRDAPFPTEFAPGSPTPPELQKIISLCVAQEPSQRPSLDALSKMLRAAQKRYSVKWRFSKPTSPRSQHSKSEGKVGPGTFYMIRSKLLY
ncbi:hypothetical protein Plec18167_002762 [Paecilomyces lecythidis]|uniref:non-specific serine/threonine protein kinase n=1 Tax=Paecilomyces lecythidis TaxID=3004212 RepID=A0ABR3Y6T2_9EURO